MRRLNENDINRIIRRVILEDEQSMEKSNPCFKNVSFTIPPSCKKIQGPKVGTSGALKCMTDLTSKLISERFKASEILKSIGCVAKQVAV